MNERGTLRKDVRPGQRIVKTESSTLLLRCGGTTGAMRPALEVGSMAAKCPTCGKREIRHPPGGKPSTGYRKHGCRCCACRAWKSGQNSARDRSKRPAEPARVHPATIAPERPRQVPQSAPQRPASPVRPVASRPAASPPRRPQTPQSPTRSALPRAISPVTRETGVCDVCRVTARCYVENRNGRIRTRCPKHKD